MQTIIDFIESYILGPLNYIDRIEGVVKATMYNDSGHTFTIPRIDKGGRYSLGEVETLLNRYGIAVYWRTYDAKHRYFRVKKRQAKWAEYLMVHAGVELQGPLLDPRNARYAAAHPAGWMPQPWSAREENQDSGKRSAGRETVPAEEQDAQHKGTDSIIRTLKNFVEW